MNEAINMAGTQSTLMREEPMVKEEIQRPQEVLQRHNITIRFLSVGCVIEIGCKTIPFTNVSEAMKELNEYVANPSVATEKWYRIFNK